MNCLKCKSKVYMNDFCRKHFIENIEKRVKKDIRRNNLISKNEKLIIKDPLSRHFINNVLNIPVKAVKTGKAREILLWTMDDEILLFLKAMFSNKKPRKLGKNRIKLFRTVKDSELGAYAKLKKLRFSKKRSKAEKQILAEIDKLEQKHKETRFSLIKSIEQLSDL